MDKYKKYGAKCKAFCIRFRKDKDQHYIDFLNSCPNKADFIRQAIDKELKLH